MDIRFTKEQVEELAPYESLMKQLIETSASSHITIEYRELIAKMVRALGLNPGCSSCGAELIRNTFVVWNNYSISKKHYEEYGKAQKDDGGAKVRKPRKGSSNNK